MLPPAIIRRGRNQPRHLVFGSTPYIIDSLQVLMHEESGVCVQTFCYPNHTHKTPAQSRVSSSSVVKLVYFIYLLVEQK